jgi:ribonuclease VapC
MVLDTSAIIAIIFDEPEREAFLRAMARDPLLAISAATLYETSIVAFGKKPSPSILQKVEGFLSEFLVAAVPLDAEGARMARDAYLQYHRAGLNLADCFSYSLAKARNEPLLFKGGDFLETDIVPAWHP